MADSNKIAVVKVIHPTMGNKEVLVQFEHHKISEIINALKRDGLWLPDAFLTYNGVKLDEDFNLEKEGVSSSTQFVIARTPVVSVLSSHGDLSIPEFYRTHWDRKITMNTVSSGCGFRVFLIAE